MDMVLYTQRVALIEDYGERRDCADQRIGAFLKACGFLSVPLPNAPEDMEEMFRQLRPCGVVLTGGNSLVKYGGDAPERDVTDAECIRLAMECCIPVYGFCRGMQSLLDYFEEELVSVEGHIAVRHRLEGKIQRDVNSYHGQACVALKTDAFDVLARSSDGVIEAIQHRQYPFLGTMWHPERDTPFQEEDLLLVQKLFGKKYLKRNRNKRSTNFESAAI